MKKAPLLVAALAAAAEIARAGAVYVDATAGAGGTGSPSAPFTTLSAGVAAASERDVVYVRGGTGRTYAVAAAEDASVFGEEGVSLVGCDAEWTPISGYAQTNDMPVVAISPSYANDCHAATGSVPDPFRVSTNNVSVSGFKFTFGRVSFRQQNKGGSGLICCHSMTNLTVEACAFVMTDATGTYSGAGTAGVINSEIVGNVTSVRGLNLRNCYFRLGKYRCSIGAFSPVGGVVNVTGCHFENLDTLCIGTGGNHNGATLNFTSNVVLNCANESDGYRQDFLYGGYNFYPTNAEIAYNRFIHDDGSTLYYSVMSHGGSYGGSFTGDVRIHHNTVRGYDRFLVSRRRSRDPSDLWTPKIFDNLLLLADGGTVVYEQGTELWYGDATCSYNDGSLFSHNGYYVGSGAFNATESEIVGYALTLSPTNCTALDGTGCATVVSWFVNTTDPSSPGYYRPGGAAADWMRRGYAGENGEYPAYLGALNPCARSGLALIVR
jgi:hypothetical protein